MIIYCVNVDRFYIGYFQGSICWGHHREEIFKLHR